MNNSENDIKPDTKLDAVTGKIREFYEDCSFPEYDGFDSPASLAQKARNSGFAGWLDDQLPLGATILEAGCGTGQLSVYLSMANRKLIGADLSHNSLRKGHAFVQKHGLDSVRFVQMDMFGTCFKPGSFDAVISSGVLHHTKDARQAFANLCTLLKPGGFFLVGLYHQWARVPTDLRRVFFKVTGGKGRGLDPVLRQRKSDSSKKNVWYRDQYENPHETKHTVGEVLGWFEENNLEPLACMPPVSFFEPRKNWTKLFAKRPWGSPLGRFFKQAGWIFSLGREGGLFVMTARKRK